GAAVGGGALVSLSSLQVTQTRVSAHAAAPSAERPARGLLRDLWVPCDGSTGNSSWSHRSGCKACTAPDRKRRRADAVARSQQGTATSGSRSREPRHIRETWSPSPPVATNTKQTARTRPRTSRAARCRG